MFTRTLQGHTHQGLLGLHLEHTALLLHLWHCCLLASTQIHQHGDLTIWIQVFEGNSLFWDNVRQQFNRNVTTILTHNDLSSELTVFGLGASYFGAANHLPANVDAGGHTLTNALYQALSTSS